MMEAGRLLRSNCSTYFSLFFFPELTRRCFLVKHCRACAVCPFFFSLAKGRNVSNPRKIAGLMRLGERGRFRLGALYKQYPTSRPHSLQWGRDQSVAETSPACITRLTRR